MSIGFRGRLVASSLVITMQAALTVVHPAGATDRPDAVVVRPVPLPQYPVGLAVDHSAGHLVTVNTASAPVPTSTQRRGYDRHGRPSDGARGTGLVREEDVMIFETKVALLLRDDLLAWQDLNVAAFLASGIAGAAPEAMGEPYLDAAGRRYVPLLGQPMLIFAASGADLLKARRIALERGLTTAAYVAAMFTSGHDAANRAAFRAEPADTPDLVGLALRGPRKDVDKATKGLRLHP